MFICPIIEVHTMQNSLAGAGLRHGFTKLEKEIYGGSPHLLLSSFPPFTGFSLTTYWLFSIPHDQQLALVFVSRGENCASRVGKTSFNCQFVILCRATAPRKQLLPEAKARGLPSRPRSSRACHPRPAGMAPQASPGARRRQRRGPARTCACRRRCGR